MVMRHWRGRTAVLGCVFTENARMPVPIIPSICDGLYGDRKKWIVPAVELGAGFYGR